MNASNSALIKQINYTYTGNQLTTEVRKVFAPNGVTIVGEVTIVYTYSGNTLVSYTETRNI
jgi:hypothetical protein